MEAAKVGGGGGEVRRLHIIYFLSRFGASIEHPHLIRVHHLARNGVFLRDVKRWLGELRGKDLPEAFAWSYKRRYKAGYVWQDLLDDDLITPISDNEYVLKGSQINPTPLENKTGLSKENLLDCVETGEKKASIQKQQSCLTEEEPPIQTYPDSASDTPRKVSSEISQESLVFSSDRSTVTDEYDCSKFEREKLDEQNPDEQSCDRVTENCTLPSSSYRNLLNKKSREKSKREDGMNSKTDTPDDSSFSTSSTSSSSPSSLKSSFRKSKSYSIAASGLFRNLITCGTADANDAVLVMLNKEGSNKSNSKLSSEICKVEKLGGPGRSFGTTWNHQQQQQPRRSCDGGNANMNEKKPGEFMTQYKPFGGPICSQCGEGFKPEKMGKHMKYCRGMKVLAKSGADKTVSEPHRSSFSNSTSSNTDSNCNYLMFT